MANHKSALKRARQTVKREARNVSVKSRVKKAVKTTRAIIEEGDSAKAKESLSRAVPIIHKAASKGVLHKRTASRKISRLAKALNRLS